MMDSQIAIFTDRQVRDRVFCRGCEELQNKNGEAWVLRNCYRHDEGFALKEILIGARPVYSDQDLTYYTTSNVSGVDSPKSAYFGLSMFFRADVHEWRAGKSAPARIRLGAEYADEIRKYLLREIPFPKNAVLCINVVTDDRLAESLWFPHGGRVQNYWRYDFVFMGLIFTLFVGLLIPQELQRLCFVRSPEHYIGMSKIADDMIFSDAARLQTQSKPVGALKSWVNKTP